jgi:hypothetical protein
MIIQFTMPGDVPSLKNSNGMNRRGQRFDNDEVRAYKLDFFYKVAREFRNKNLGNKAGLLGCIIRIYHRDWRRDADVEIIYDCLQTAGVVLNDRWIRNKLVLGDLLDAENPRAEITLFTLGDPDIHVLDSKTYWQLRFLLEQFLGAPPRNPVFVPDVRVFKHPEGTPVTDFYSFGPSPEEFKGFADEFVKLPRHGIVGKIPTGKRPRQRRGVRRLPEGA